MNALRFACMVSFLLAPLCVHACSTSSEPPSKSAQAKTRRSTEMVHEACELESKGNVTTDANGDGRADITRVMSKGKEICRAIDLNFDGRVDSFTYFDPSQNHRRRESDFDRDGQVDEIAYFQNGKIVSKERETNLDGRIDTWDFYRNELLFQRERDSNSDGRIDQWWTFPDPQKLECPVVMSDQDGDGQPDSRQDVCADEAATAGAPAPTSPPTSTPIASNPDAGELLDAAKGQPEAGGSQ